MSNDEGRRKTKRKATVIFGRALNFKEAPAGLSNKRQALEESARRAAAALVEVDLSRRCARLGLPPPQADGVLRLPVLGRVLEFAPPEFAGRAVDNGRPAHPVDRLLLLHYLLGDAPLEPGGEPITFRQFPGGQFYWEPFRSRSLEPLAREIGDDLELLRRRLNRFDWTAVERGDLGARVRVFGKLEVTLVYYRGDEEFAPDASILFDACLPRAFRADLAAGLASRVCLGLCVKQCEPCYGCGICDSALTE